MTRGGQAGAGREQRLVLWLEEIAASDIGLVGGRNASLGEMYTTLSPRGIRVQNG